MADYSSDSENESGYESGHAIISSSNPLTWYQQYKFLQALSKYENFEEECNFWLERLNIGYDENDSVIENLEKVGSGGYNYLVRAIQNMPAVFTLATHPMNRQEMFSYAIVDKNCEVIGVGLNWDWTYEAAQKEAYLYCQEFYKGDKFKDDWKVLITSDCKCRSSCPYYPRDSKSECYNYHKAVQDVKNLPEI